jgi:hypothetical protein
MANAVKVFVTRSAHAPAPARHRTTGSRTRDDHDERLPGWVLLLPLAPLVIIGLLVLSLGRIAPPSPVTPAAPSPDADPDLHVLVPVADERDVIERMVRFGPAISR